MTNTLFIGKVYNRFDVLTSTNDWAGELLSKSKPPEGTVVRADSQSAGRGQFGSRWESEPGKNLMLSVILYPTWLESSAQFYLSMAVALALRDTVDGGRWTVDGGRETADGRRQTVDGGRLIAIKWPNDLYLGDRKAAGILIQNTLSGQFIQSSVVGIGLNVNQMEFDPSLPNPTSLELFFGEKFDLDDLAERLFECIEHRYLQLKSCHRTPIKDEYEQSLFRFGEPANFIRMTDGGSEFTGTIRGVTETGRLRIETSAGEATFDVKEVRFVI